MLKKLIIRALGFDEIIQEQKQIRRKMREHGYDILTIMGKQLASESISQPPDPLAMATEHVVIENAGGHRYVCVDCGGVPIEQCKAGKHHTNVTL